jgi:tetratricopeptide (TPR) repeat protein
LGHRVGVSPDRGEQQEITGDMIQQMLDRIRELMDQGRTDEALALLEQAIAQNPELTIAHLQMGSIFRDQGDLSAAEQSFSRAANLEPRNFDAQFNHADVLHALGRVVDSVRAYLRALAIRPNDAAANRGLAAAYLEQQRPDWALEYAEQAVRSSPNDGTARANLGATYSLLDRHEEAIREYETAAELMELTPDLLLNWANSLGAIERYTEMINTLDAALNIQPSATAYERLGFAYFKTRRFDRATEMFRSSLDMDQRHYPALNGLGVVLLNEYVQGGRNDDSLRIEALSLLRRSLRINSNQPAFVQLVSTYSRG